uniref:IBB domain-containing protein n=1 Tax=Panagrellus redivivus TaxID=6233 RepID=A0A7E4ZRR2_PANRE
MADNSHDSLFKNTGRTLASERQRRNEFTVVLRRQKREDAFSARRAMLNGAPSTGNLEEYSKYNLYDDEVTTKLFSEDPSQQEFALNVYAARFKDDPVAARTELWDMMNYGALSALFSILQKSEKASKVQFLCLRIFAVAVEDPDLALAMSTAIELHKYIMWNFTNFDTKCIGDVLIILCYTVRLSSIPTNAEQVPFLIDRCRRLCLESPMPYIRNLAAQAVSKIAEGVEEPIELPKCLVGFAGDLIVSDTPELRISGYQILNACFSSYTLGNLVISSDRWRPVLERCSTVNDDELDEAYLVIENLANFMLPYELTACELIPRMVSVIQDPQFNDTQRQLRALTVLTELSLSTMEKQQLLVDDFHTQLAPYLANIINFANYDTRRQALILLRNLFITIPKSVPLFTRYKTICGLSDLLTVMHAETVVASLEILKAILDDGGRPNADPEHLFNGEPREFIALVEEAKIGDRIDFLVGSQNEQVSLLALELLHVHLDRNDDETNVDLPDDLADIGILSEFKF